MADELTDAAKAEIAAAVAIVKEDRIYKAIHEGRTPKPGDPPKPEDPPGPKPPPAKDPAEPPKRKGVWWGDQITDDPPEPAKEPDPA